MVPRECLGSLFHADGPMWEKACSPNLVRSRGSVARSRSMRMIVGEDAVCWHSLSERLVLCLADFLVTRNWPHCCL